MSEVEDLNQTETDPKRVNKAIAYACRILGMREYSQKMLQQKVLNKGYDLAETSQVISFLLENNWLSDQRFCEVFVRSKVNRGQGLTRIRFELKEKGISGEMLDAVLTQQPICWQDICNQVVERKVSISSLKNNIKARQKLERFLRYRGFSGEQVRISINQYLNK